MAIGCFRTIFAEKILQTSNSRICSLVGNRCLLCVDYQEANSHSLQRFSQDHRISSFCNVCSRINGLQQLQQPNISQFVGNLLVPNKIVPPELSFSCRPWRLQFLVGITFHYVGWEKMFMTLWNQPSKNSSTQQTNNTASINTHGKQQICQSKLFFHSKNVNGAPLAYHCNKE